MSPAANIGHFYEVQSLIRDYLLKYELFNMPVI